MDQDVEPIRSRYPPDARRYPVGEPPFFAQCWRDYDGVVRQELIKHPDVLESSSSRREVIVKRHCKRVFHCGSQPDVKLLEVCPNPFPPQPGQLLNAGEPPPVSVYIRLF